MFISKQAKLVRLASVDDIDMVKTSENKIKKIES